MKSLVDVQGGFVHTPAMGLHLSDVRGFVRLATTGTLRVTDVVETVHAELLRRPRFGRGAASRRTRGLTGFVYGCVRGITTLAGGAADAALGCFDQGRTPTRHRFRAVLNGVVGDHLHATGNPLAIDMTFRYAGHVLHPDRAALAALVPRDAARLVVLVHGLCFDDAGWDRQGQDYGARLARDLGVLPVYLRYNTGLNVSTNGRALSLGLEALAAAWPCPVEEITLIGYSMGGLVARSACHHAAVSRASWARPLRAVVCVGTPHHGVPLERLGNRFETLLSSLPYAAGLGRIGHLRSAGITDMRHGNVLDEHWQDRGRFEPGIDRRGPARLPHRVRCHAIAGTKGQRRGDLRDRMLGDGLVHLASALGEHPDPALEVASPETRFIAYGTGHLQLLDSNVVYEQIRAQLARADAQP